MSRFVTPAFIRSPVYTALMSSRVPAAGPGLHEMQDRTPSAVLRHADIAPLLGVWRWRGIQRHAEAILRELASAFVSERMMLDFGGAGGPLGLGSHVVDLLDADATGARVMFHSLDHVRHFTTHEPVATCVFTSHALEHIADLDAALRQIRDALTTGGLLIAHVPAWTCVRWRAGVHTSPDYAPHVWTFGIEDKPPVAGLVNYANVAARIAESGLAVELAEYCGDDSIMVMARKVD